METKLIFNASVARYLLKKGNAIVDIKPNKNDPCKTVFVFEKTEKFIKDFVGFSSHKE